MTFEYLQEQIFTSFCKNPCALLGYDSYNDVVRDAQKSGVFVFDDTMTAQPMRVGGCLVYSNELPGTRGFWIGEQEEMEVIRRYIKSGYFHENTIEVIGPGASTSRVWKPQQHTHEHTF
jgi:hypothetical protein